MGYSIQPVQIWTNGQASEGNFIDASIVNDNLSDYLQSKLREVNLKIAEVAKEQLKSQLNNR